MRILLVDHDERIRRSLGRMLAQLEDVAVVLESDGAAAIGQTHAWKPHLVVVDLELLDMDGVRCALAMRVLAPTLPIVFLSANTDAQLVAEARTVPISLLIRKPCASDVLRDAAEMFRP